MENYEFFEDLVNRVKGMVSDPNPNGIIRISVVMITKLGYHNKQSFEDEFLYKIFTKVAREMESDIETIEEKTKDRTVYI